MSSLLRVGPDGKGMDWREYPLSRGSSLTKGWSAMVDDSESEVECTLR